MSRAKNVLISLISIKRSQIDCIESFSRFCLDIYSQFSRLFINLLKIIYLKPSKITAKINMFSN